MMHERLEHMIRVWVQQHVSEMRLKLEDNNVQLETIRLWDKVLNCPVKRNNKLNNRETTPTLSQKVALRARIVSLGSLIV